MIEAIAHLIHRDYSEIGNDFVNLDFIPRGVDTGETYLALELVKASYIYAHTYIHTFIQLITTTLKLTSKHVYKYTYIHA